MIIVIVCRAMILSHVRIDYCIPDYLYFFSEEVISIISGAAWGMRKGIFSSLSVCRNWLFDSDLTHRSWAAKVTFNLFRMLYARMSPSHYRQMCFERQSLGAPWLVPDAIRQIEQFLKPHHVGFEWGSGRSTLWFARRTSHITSIEGRRDWFEEISR